MFIDEGVFKKLLKEAYKSNHLSVECFEDAAGNYKLAISGYYWVLEVLYSQFCNKSKAALIELIGDIPDVGMAYEYGATASEPQQALEGSIRENIAEEYKEATTQYTQSDVFFNLTGSLYAVMQTRGDKLLCPQGILNMVKPDNINREAGESDVDINPLLHKSGKCLLWSNNVMGLLCYVSAPRLKKAVNTLECLSAVDCCWRGDYE